jgi:hypothetical protein
LLVNPPRERPRPSPPAPIRQAADETLPRRLVLVFHPVAP